MSILNPQSNPNPQGRFDYSQLPISQSQLPFQHETPEEYDRRQEQAQGTAEKAFFTQGVTRCQKFKHPPSMAKIVFACSHCTTQDEVHPDGIIFSPFKYFLCTTCYRQHMLRKLDLAQKLKIFCMPCIMDEMARIKLINPNLVKDFTTEKPN